MSWFCYTRTPRAPALKPLAFSSTPGLSFPSFLRICYDHLCLSCKQNMMPSHHPIDLAYRDPRHPAFISRDQDHEYDDHLRPRKHRSDSRHFNANEVYGLQLYDPGRSRHVIARRPHRAATVLVEEAVQELNVTLKDSKNTLLKIVKAFDDDTRGVQSYADDHLMDMLWQLKLAGPRQSMKSNGKDSYGSEQPRERAKADGKSLDEVLQELDDKFAVVGIMEKGKPNLDRRSGRIHELRKCISQKAKSLERKYEGIYVSCEVLKDSIKILDLTLAELDSYKDLWDPHGKGDARGDARGDDRTGHDNGQYDQTDFPDDVGGG